MRERLRPYLFFLGVLLVDFLMGFKSLTLTITSLKVSLSYLVEMLTIIPPIFLLVGLLDVWVPRKIVEENVGKDSGIKGILISFLLGTAAAGPLYAAFPVAEAMLKKGGRLANVTILLNTWAALKIPMIAMEINYLGLRFALTRFFLTLPFIILTAYLTERICQKSIEPTINLTP